MSVLSRGDSWLAFCAIATASLLGLSIWFWAPPTRVPSFGFPPWGNTSLGAIECDANICRTVEGSANEGGGLPGIVGDYPWRRQQPTARSRLTAWLCYAAHQLSSWVCLYTAQQMRSAQRYTARLRPMNFVALAANASFIGLHLLQGRYSFDGLSQDLPFWSSQAPPPALHRTRSQASRVPAETTPASSPARSPRASLHKYKGA